MKQSCIYSDCPSAFKQADSPNDATCLACRARWKRVFESTAPRSTDELKRLLLALYSEDKTRITAIREAAQYLIDNGETDERVVALARLRT